MARPKTLTAGNSIQWTESCTKYLPSEGWTAKFVAVNQSGKHEAAATIDGEKFVFNIGSSLSREFSDGIFRAFIFVFKGEDRKTLASWDMQATPDPEHAAHDFRSHAEIVLAAVEAVIQKTASKDQQTLVVDGQTLVRRSIADLIKLRDLYRAEVKRERKARRYQTAFPTRDIRFRMK